MTANIKSLANGQLASSKGTIYTCPAATQAIIQSIVLVNILSEKIKGRRALIQIPEINLPKLEKIIIEILKLKGINI